MNLIHLISLLVYTLGLFSFGTILLLWVRGFVKGRWGHGRGGPPAFGGPGELAGAAIILVSFAWFGVNLFLQLILLNPEIPQWPAMTLFLFLVFLYPPLIMHANYREERCSFQESAQEPRRPEWHPAWRYAIVAMYVVSPSMAIFSILGFHQILPIPISKVSTISTTAMAVLFIFAMAFSMAVSTIHRKQSKKKKIRTSRRWIAGLYGLAILLFGASILTTLGWIQFHDVLDLAAKSLPLMFLFVVSYHENRFEFLDLFLKRGLALMIALVSFTFWFAFSLHWLEGRISWFGLGGAGLQTLGWARPLVYALCLLPIAFFLLWLYRRLGQWLDNVWLGRQFTTLEAVKHFLSTLQTATTERQLLERAEKGISDIFQAPTRIQLKIQAAPDPDFEFRKEVPIHSERGQIGVIQLGTRTGNTPFFSEDLALAGSLAEVFSFLFQNLRLRERQQEQERLARELSFQANQSELKALRAQINPHFLFNALNAIAGLIHKNPLRADKTVERLADVFRYTLRRSENEWTLLEEEMEFVRAYLEVEQARFGKRLQFRIHTTEEIRSIRIPTMTIQTLVENAVKHGVSSVRGPGIIEISAVKEGAGVRIDVADNGPGFPLEDPLSDSSPGRKATGYGLKNIVQRLEGYYGEASEFSIRRDKEREMTVVSFRIPVTEEELTGSVEGGQDDLKSGGAA